ncbi:MAG TPA: UvrD-helicase domain-containing protein [Candidatus Kapabacteria bacterium]|nr:UvrD-helicase domain-containing protein [Candidatus Kapabacteria bacterium]
MQSKLLTGLNPQQLEAVTKSDGPTMVVAGAGSGKTRVLTHRIAYLLERGVRPWEILALTFTNKAAGEMKERIAALVGGDLVADLWMGTFHSIFARILRRHAELLGFTKSFSIYDTDDTLALIKRTMERLNIARDQFNPNSIRSRISSLKNNLISPEDFANMARDLFSEKVAEVYPEYTKGLREANAMDFDDLLVKTIELFVQHPEVIEVYRRKFRYILVDEYQDTNRAQYIVIKYLSDEYHNLTVVGDDAQSIYAFRGADIKNILDFQNDYPDVQTFRLEQNYRSTGNILATADTLIKQNTKQIPKTLFTENPKGDAVKIVECSDEREEGAFIVRQLEDEIRKERYGLNNFAVLYRTNAQSRALEDAMRRQGIPYIIIGGVAFYKRKEIKDALAYIRLLVNPADSESVLRVINFPARGIGESTMKRVAEFARERGTYLLDVLAMPEMIPGVLPRLVTKLKAFHDLIEKYRKVRDELSPSELLRSLIDETGMLTELKLENTLESLARYENLREFLSAITDHFATKAEATIESFLEEISLVSDIDNIDGAKNAVTLMTLHAAKGLEYPVVFVTGLEEGLFPNPNTSFDDFSIEEERRLLYVGITRAMKKCFLTYAKSRLKYGDYSSAMPSRFLEEIKETDSIEMMTSYGTPISTLRSGRSSSEIDFVSTSRVFNGSATIGNRTFGTKKFSSSHSSYSQDEAPDDYSQTENTSNNLRKGARVIHEIFGEGRILELSGKGDNAKAVVDFDGRGRKNLMLKFAKLKVL